MRTNEEIIARIRLVEAQGLDWLGTETTDLLAQLPYDVAKPWLKAEAAPSDWPAPMTDDEIRAKAIDYLSFAFGKASDHRGISAGRSVDHYAAWLWLLGVLPENWGDIAYVNYGVPRLVAAAIALGVEPALDSGLRNMSEGNPCEPGCQMGCGT